MAKERTAKISALHGKTTIVPFDYWLYVVLIGCVFSNQPACSADWGYDDYKSNPERKEVRSSAPGTINGASQAGGTALGDAPANPGSGPFARNPMPSNDEVIAANWINLYKLASTDKLMEGQIASYRIKILTELKSKRDPELLAVGKFWPTVSRNIKEHPELAELFGQLFRALLRLEARGHKGNTVRLMITQEVLGPERIAVPGDPALTEEAIDAYNDMACFLYEQKHKDKTIDASDNRTIMAAMICDRYKEAPTQEARLSMANFALNWAKFKILWANASESERKLLISQFDCADFTKRVSVSDPTVELVLRHGPWSTLLYKKLERGKKIH